MLFRDRRDAGQKLARELLRYRDEAPCHDGATSGPQSRRARGASPGPRSPAGPIVLGLPRGGVVVAYEVARALRAQLDVWVVRKLGAPIQPELGMGALAEGGELLLERSIVELVGASEADVSQVIEQEARELERRVRRYRRGRPQPALRGRTVIVVDDGIATGSTVRAVLRAMRRREAARSILAVPVAAADTVAQLRAEVDEVVCLHAAQQLGAIGVFYRDFTQVGDEDVVALLERARKAKTEAPAHG